MTKYHIIAYDSWGFTSFDFISSCPIVTNFISDLMKSKPISLNMVIFVMFISRSISTLVNQEDSPTLSKTYLSGPISTSSQDHLQDHQEYLRTISRTIIRTISGPQDFHRTSGAGQDGYTPALPHQGFTDSRTCFSVHSMLWFLFHIHP